MSSLFWIDKHRRMTTEHIILYDLTIRIKKQLRLIEPNAEWRGSAKRAKQSPKCSAVNE